MLETPPPVKLVQCEHWALTVTEFAWPQLMMLKMHEYDFMQSRVLESRVNGDTHSCRVHQANEHKAWLCCEHLEDLMFVESEPSTEDDSFFFSLFPVIWPLVITILLLLLLLFCVISKNLGGRCQRSTECTEWPTDKEPRALRLMWSEGHVWTFTCAPELHSALLFKLYKTVLGLNVFLAVMWQLASFVIFFVSSMVDIKFKNISWNIDRKMKSGHGTTIKLCVCTEQVIICLPISDNVR